VIRVLFIDDEEDAILGLKLLHEDWESTGMTDPAPLLRGEIDVNSYDVILVDLVLRTTEEKADPTIYFRGPDPRSGFRVLEWLKENAPDKPVVVISALVDSPSFREAFERRFPGIPAFGKPLDFSHPAFVSLVERLAGLASHG